jgi:tripartite-type tricarboxylate transporter receptor subunit TctC
MQSTLARIASVLSAALFCAGVVYAQGTPNPAQNYPSKTVRMIVPWPPGGTTDILGRMISQELTKTWGHQVIVDNRAGASAIIGTDLLAKSPPDGYTIGMLISTHVVNPSLYGKVPFDPLKDFIPITLVANVTDFVSVNPSLPVKNLKELVALMKAKPGQIAFASSGSGTSTHLAGELFKLTAGVNINHIPYKGGSPAITDLVGGQVQMMFGNATSILPFIRSGKVRAVAVTSIKRSPALPQVPTVAESGYPGFEVNEWYGVAAPAGTPRPIIDKLHAEILRYITSPEVRDRLVNQMGADVVGMPPDEYARFMKTEYEKWTKVVKQGNLKAE